MASQDAQFVVAQVDDFQAVRPLRLMEETGRKFFQGILAQVENLQPWTQNPGWNTHVGKHGGNAQVYVA